MSIMIIGISGPSASGKSLLAKTIIEELGSEQVVIISEDSYYKNHANLPFAEREKLNYDHPDAFDHDLLHHHLQQLKQGRTIEIPVYNHAQHLRLTETRTIDKYSIVVLEGILLLSDPRLRDNMNIRIFIDTPLDICLMRRLKRDLIQRNRTLESVFEQYESTVRPMYLKFIDPSRRYADIIVPRGGENRIAIDMIKAKMREAMAEI